MECRTFEIRSHMRIHMRRQTSKQTWPNSQFGTLRSQTGQPICPRRPFIQLSFRPKQIKVEPILILRWSLDFKTFGFGIVLLLLVDHCQRTAAATSCQKIQMQNLWHCQPQFCKIAQLMFSPIRFKRSTISQRHFFFLFISWAKRQNGHTGKKFSYS